MAPFLGSARTAVWYTTRWLGRSPAWLTVVLFVLSTGCYVYRALLEEKFLSQDPEYQEYKRRVRWRFLPWVF